MAINVRCSCCLSKICLSLSNTTFGGIMMLEDGVAEVILGVGQRRCQDWEVPVPAGVLW